MLKSQWILITLGLCSVLTLYTFGRTKPNHKKGAAEPGAPTEEVNEQGILAEARAKLDSAQRVWWATLEQQRNAAAAENVAQEAEVLKLMSRTWFEWNQPGPAAFYAEQVARLRPSGEAWSIAGTTYGIAFNRSQDEAVRRWAARKAIEAFDKAAQEEPDTLRHQINQAVMWIDLSSVDASVMPMKGIGLLRELDAAHPDNVAVNMTLGRLSLVRSGDVQKAIPRFEKIVEIAGRQKVEPELLLEAHYSLAECFTRLGDKQRAAAEYDSCLKWTQDQALREELLAAKKALSQPQ